MQHSDCTPRIPTVTAEEAVKMSWLWSSSQTLKEVSQLFNAIAYFQLSCFTQTLHLALYR